MNTDLGYNTDLEPTPEQAHGAKQRTSKPESLKRTIIRQIRFTPGEDDLITEAAKRDGYGERSSFIRAAINDRLDKMGLY